MPDTFEIRPLGELPWPHGLGKMEYPRLRDRLKNLMGDRYGDVEANRLYFENVDDYGQIVFDELRHESWAQDLPDTVRAAVALARTSNMLDRPLSRIDDWTRWTHTVADPYDPTHNRWLRSPAKVANNRIGDGRHRITFLRLTEPPTFEVLVRVSRD